VRAQSDFHGVGIGCVGNAVNRIHNLAPKHDRRAETLHFPLIECIESEVEQLFLGAGAGYMETPVYDTNSFPGNASRPAGAIWIRQKIRKIVLATNFRAQHDAWHLTLAEIEAALQAQAAAHTQLAHRLQAKYGVKYQRLFISANAVHGFITAGLTPSRQERVNVLATSILRRAGWQVLDAYNMSLARPDLTVEGLHARGGLSRALTDVLLNSITNEDC